MWALRRLEFPGFAAIGRIDVFRGLISQLRTTCVLSLHGREIPHSVPGRLPGMRLGLCQARTVCGSAEGHEQCQRLVADRDPPFEALTVAAHAIEPPVSEQGRNSGPRCGLPADRRDQCVFADRAGLATRAGGRGRRPFCRLPARRDPFTAPCLTPARAAEASRRRGPSP